MIVNILQWKKKQSTVEHNLHIKHLTRSKRALIFLLSSRELQTSLGSADETSSLTSRLYRSVLTRLGEWREKNNNIEKKSEIFINCLFATCHDTSRMQQRAREVYMAGEEERKRENVFIDKFDALTHIPFDFRRELSSSPAPNSWLCASPASVRCRLRAGLSLAHIVELCEHCKKKIQTTHIAVFRGGKKTTESATRTMLSETQRNNKKKKENELH